MNEWMASSQLMITKPGGITISEALTRQIPMIFLDLRMTRVRKTRSILKKKVMVQSLIHPMKLYNK